MVNVRVTYDRTVNAAYIYLADPDAEVTYPNVAHTYPCDPAGVGGMINLDFDKDGALIGVEVLAASSKLPQYMLDGAERPGTGRRS